MIHGYYGGKQHEGMKSKRYVFDMDNLSKINNICIDTNKAIKEINDEYENSFPTSRLKESFSILARTYIDLSKVSPRYEFISEACIQKVASSLRLDFSRDSLYEFDFLKAVEDSKILYDETVKELADTMLHRYLLGGTLDTVKNPSAIKHYNDLYKEDPILGIKKIIEDRDIKKFKNPETVKEQKDAIEKEPERLKLLMEEMENIIDSPKPT